MIKLTQDEYIERAKKIHGDKYDYSLVDYSKYRDMVSIICKEHGVFTVDGAEFIHNTRSVSCPSCRGSRGEKEIIRILNSNSISFIKEYNFKTHAKFKYDFYLQDLNILIEYDGVQHYKPVSVFGGIDAFIQQKKRDKLKNMLAKEKNIPLIRIPYTTKNIQNYLVNKISLIKKKQCPL